MEIQIIARYNRNIYHCGEGKSLTQCLLQEKNDIQARNDFVQRQRKKKNLHIP